MYNVFPSSYWLILHICSVVAFLTTLVVIYHVRLLRVKQNVRLIKSGPFKNAYYIYLIIVAVIDMITVNGLVTVSYLIYERVIPVNDYSSYYMKIVFILGFVVIGLQILKAIASSIMALALVAKQKEI